MEGIDFDIVFDNDKTSYKKENELDYALTECDVRTMTFYRIDAISPFIDDDEYKTEYSYIHTSGDKFICVLTYDELKQALKAWKTSNAIQS